MLYWLLDSLLMLLLLRIHGALLGESMDISIYKVESIHVVFGIIQLFQNDINFIFFIKKETINYN